MHAELWRPDELNEGSFALGVDEHECVDPEALDHAVGARDSSVGHGPEEHVRRLFMQEGKVPEVIVCGLALRDFVVGLGFEGVDEIGELWSRQLMPYLNRFVTTHLDGFLDEEHWYIVAHDVPITFIGVEFDREASDVSDSVCATSTALYGGETDEDRSCSGGVSQDPR